MAKRGRPKGSGYRKTHKMPWQYHTRETGKWHQRRWKREQARRAREHPKRKRTYFPRARDRMGRFRK